jgi:hypothetical protein
MSVTSSLHGLLPSYGADSGNNSQIARIAGRTERLQERTPARADGSQGTSTRGAPVTLDFAVSSDGKSTAGTPIADSGESSHLQSALAQALRAIKVAGATQTSGPPGSQGSTQSSRGAALYKLVSQMGSSDPSTSALLKSWNSIMQTGQDAGGTWSGAMHSSLHGDGPSFDAVSSLHLTA